MDFTWSQILSAALLSFGGMGGFITAIVKISGMVEARRKRIAEGKKDELHNSVEGRRLQLEQKSKDREEAWRIIAEQKSEIADLKKEIKELEDGRSFARPKVTQIYRNLRRMEEEINHLDVMVFDHEQTNEFMRRLGELKRLMGETRDLLP
jgi:septal ring factor EnvC (AmiA/AmiB activator)